MRRALALLACSALLVLSSREAGAVPSPANSTVPCLVACPGGDLSFTIVVRDLINIPIVGSMVTVEFPECASFVHCPQVPTGYLWDSGGRRAVVFTNAVGEATFALMGGGVCPGASVRVYADGVLLAARGLASTDQEGDLYVGLGDEALASGKLGTADPTADFDCSGVVTAADVAVITAHVGHGCEPVTPTVPRTWGRIKQLYR
jgi:hypothetical protein